MADDEKAKQSAFSQLGVPAAPAGVPTGSDFSKLGVAAAPATTASPAAPPEPEPTTLSGQVKKGIQTSIPGQLFKPPESPSEQLIHAVGGQMPVGGDAALAAYRAATGVVNSAKNLVSSLPAEFEASKQKLGEALDEFHRGNYGKAADAAIASPVAEAALPGLTNTREVNEGARRGNVVTPLVRQGIDAATNAGAAVVGGEMAGAEDTAATSASRLRVNPFRAKILASPEEAGEATVQNVAQSGVRAIARPVGPSLRSGIDVTTPLAEAKNIYAAADKAAPGVDFKGLADRLDAAMDRERLTAPGSPEQAKALADVDSVEKSMNDARATASKSNVSLDKTLKAADAKFQEVQANKDFNSKFFGKVVSGNVAHGAPESIDVNQGIKILEDMDKPNKYGQSRLQQTSLGKDGAFQLKQVLYDAQKAGKTAVDARVLRNRVAKIAAYAVPAAGTVVGGAYELLK
jgi:hypothetical protein